MDAPPMSQEELDEMMKLLESYESGGKIFGPVPEELHELIDNVKRAKGQPTGDVATENITPEPGFVVKTTDQDGNKVFINMCHSKQVPAPGGWKNGVMPDSVLKALDDLQRDQPSTDAEALRFPLSCSEVLPGTDKAGQPCSTVDCIMHTDILAAAQQHRPLKAFLVELALEWVGSKHKMQLDPRFKLPKMAYKGSEVRSQRVRLDRKPLVEDVTLQQLQQEEPPNFPLMPTKAAATKVAAASSKAATAASKHEARQADVAADNGSQTRSSRLPAAAAAANESSNRSSRWQYSVKCEGKPVSYMLVTLQLPPAGNSGSSSSSWSASGIIAEVCGRQLRVTAAAVLSEDPCVVELPFAAGSEGAMAQLLAGGTHLQVRLPYLPLQQWVQQLATKSPHVFSKLPVAHQTYMELDE